jgi:predicted aspartyl protease
MWVSKGSSKGSSKDVGVQRVASKGSHKNNSQHSEKKFDKLWRWRLEGILSCWTAFQAIVFGVILLIAIFLLTAMGITYINGQVRGPSGKSADLKFLVDSGATYSLIPFPIWQILQIEPKQTVEVALADGTFLERQAGECRFSISSKEAGSPVILGEEGDEPLLGVLTLENLGLVLNPLNRTLRPMRIRM